jgi:lysophospholipase L1-like esterase
MPSQEKGFLLKAVIIISIALIGSLLALDGGLRLLADTGMFDRQLYIFGKERPPLDSKTGGGMYYAHHYNAYGLKPGYTNGTRERINSLGFRGEEISLPKPDGVYRIIAVGGSTTFGVYLPWNESYPYYLQEELRERFGTDAIEVVNGGLTGSTAAESFHRLPTQLLPADPDMVVVYHAFNDLLPRVFNGYEDDYYHFRRSNPNNPPGLTRSYVYRLALRVLSPAYFHENYNLSNLVWKTENLPETDTELAQNFLSSNNDAFRFNMDNIIELLDAKDITVVLSTFAMHPDIWHWQEIIPPYMWEIGIRENNEAIRDLASEYQLPLVPFADAPIKEGRESYGAGMYSDSIHMSTPGNRFKAEIFADTIAPLIAEKLGVPVPPPSKYAESAAAIDVSVAPL